jgi:hypothetical protein
MKLNDVLNNGESKARITAFAGTGLVHPVKAFKDSIKSMLWDAIPVVRHTDLKEALFSLIAGHGHLLPFTGILDGILKEVEKNLTQARFVGLKGEHGIYPAIDINIPIGRFGSQFITDFNENLM